MKKYNIERFVDAHQRSYSFALSEIRVEYKVSHWMWYIFPQIKGLGHSEIAEYYAVENLDEAKAYLNEGNDSGGAYAGDLRDAAGE